MTPSPEKKEPEVTPTKEELEAWARRKFPPVGVLTGADYEARRFAAHALSLRDALAVSEKRIEELEKVVAISRKIFMERIVKSDLILVDGYQVKELQSALSALDTLEGGRG